MAYNEIAKKATIKYIKEKRDRIEINVAKGKKEEYRKQAETNGMNLSEYIINLLEKEKKGE